MPIMKNDGIDNTAFSKILQIRKKSYRAGIDSIYK